LKSGRAANGCHWVPSDGLATASYHDHAVSEAAGELDRFYLAHRRCGALTSGPHGDDAVWMSSTCGATILVPTREEGPKLDLDHP